MSDAKASNLFPLTTTTDSPSSPPLTGEDISHPDRVYLPNAFRFLLPSGEVEGTLFAVPHGPGHLVDVEGSLMTPPSGSISFASLQELAQKSGWPKADMDALVKRLSALPTAR